MNLPRPKYIKIVVFLLLMATPILVWTQRWDIHDYLRLRNYQPPKGIVKLADDTTMKPESRKLFYVYHPELNTKQSFNSNCHTSEKTIVLGCYVSGIGIYIYEVSDERLDGILQVTAAHEMLHAAYDRLSGSDKSRIDSLVNAQLSEITNQRILDTIVEYRSNGADISNELHSILATEIRSLNPELEKYYSGFFTDRLKLVEYSEHYEEEFSGRKAKIIQYDEQLKSLKSQIDTGQANLTTSYNNLQNEKSRLDNLLAAKNYANYNAGVSGYNGLVGSYNSTVRKIRELIDDYNNIVNKRNEIAAQESELVKAIDSRPETISQ